METINIHYLLVPVSLGVFGLIVSFCFAGFWLQKAGGTAEGRLFNPASSNAYESPAVCLGTNGALVVVGQIRKSKPPRCYC